jgi:myo-inositol 2-dehydrogenase / D-chiro-inositol 1-dehydrogenase
MNKLKVGILGAGYIGAVHAGILARDQRVTITAVHDLIPQRAVELARSSGAQVLDRADQLIESVDALYITTPNTRHTSLALSAIAAGKHVFCEKPLATNLDDARAVLESVSSATSLFQVGHNRRFAPVYVALRRLLFKGNQPHSAHLKMNRGELVNPTWVGNPEVTGGFLYETTIHMFDMARFLFGEVKAMTAVGSRHRYPETDDFSVLLEFNNGLHATMASSADASWLFPFERVEVFCHHSTFVTREMEALTYTKRLGVQQTTLSMGTLSREEKWGYAQEDQAFIDSITTGQPPAVSALDGYKSVQLVDACYRAANTGTRILLT